MKRVDLTGFEDEEFEQKLDEYPGFCGSKDSPDEVLREVDRLLKGHGLEVVIADAGDTSTLFNIIKRNSKKVTKRSKA
jgi:hypothetical protein